MLRTLFMITLLTMAPLLAGCGSPRSERPSIPKTTVVTWPEYQEFMSDEVMQPLVMPAAENQWKAVAKQAKSASFKAAFDKFSQSSLPSEHESEERTAALETLKEKYKALIAESEGSADKKKLESIYFEIQVANAAVIKPNS